VPMAQAARGEATEWSRGAVHPGLGADRASAAAHDGGQAPARVGWMASRCTADARTTEEPETGNLYVRDCTGGAG
jgi:hypothetical protein